MIVNKVHPSYVGGAPAARTRLKAKAKRALRDAGVPDPTAGRAAQNLVHYQALADRDRENIASLERRIGSGPIVEVPLLDHDIHDLEGVAAVGGTCSPRARPQADGGTGARGRTASRRASTTSARVPPVAAGEPAAATTHTPPGTGEPPARSSSRQRRRSAWVGGRVGERPRAHLRPHERHVGRRGTGLREDVERGPVGAELRLRDDRKDVAVAERQRPAPKRRRRQAPVPARPRRAPWRRRQRRCRPRARERRPVGPAGASAARPRSAARPAGTARRESQERHVAQPAQERRRAEERARPRRSRRRRAHAAAGIATRMPSRHGSAAADRCLAPSFHPRTRPAIPSGSATPSATAACATVGLAGGSRGDVGEPAEAVVGDARAARARCAATSAPASGRPGRDRRARTQSQRRCPERRGRGRQAARTGTRGRRPTPGCDEPGPRARVERPDERPQDERGHAHPQVARDERRQVAHSGDEGIREHQVAVVAAEVARAHVEDGGGAVLPEPAEAAAGDGEHGAGRGGRRASPERAHEEPHPDGDRREAQHVDRRRALRRRRRASSGRSTP